jgi:hypothetical protein
MLNELGFVWNLKREGRRGKMTTTIKNLKSYKEENGHCNMCVTDGSSFGVWVRNQERSSFQRNEMQEDWKKMLEEIGFIWSAPDDLWLANFEKLRKFRDEHGHTVVPNDNGLSEWMSRQRLQHSAGQLDETRTAMLDEIEFMWEDPAFAHQERLWNARFCELEDYKREHRYVKVPVHGSPLGE